MKNINIPIINTISNIEKGEYPSASLSIFTFIISIASLFFSFLLYLIGSLFIFLA